MGGANRRRGLRLLASLECLCRPGNSACEIGTDRPTENTSNTDPGALQLCAI